MSAAHETRQCCQAIRKDGTPCRAPAAGGTPYCIGHRPESQADRAKGGAATSNAARAMKLLPARLQPVVAILEAALVQTFQGRMEPRRAVALAAVAGALVRCVQAGELEERLRAVEDAAKREQVPQLGQGVRR